MLKFNLFIDASHPCLVGHFPNNPIVPAVILIDHIIQGVHKQFPTINIHNITQLKFIQPLKPEQQAQVIITEKSLHVLHVRIEVEQQIFVKGEMQITRGEQP